MAVGTLIIEYSCQHVLLSCFVRVCYTLVVTMLFLVRQFMLLMLKRVLITLQTISLIQHSYLMLVDFLIGQFLILGMSI